MFELFATNDEAVADTAIADYRPSVLGLRQLSDMIEILGFH